MGRFACLALIWTFSVPAAFAAERVVNVRDFGALGDGRAHPIEEWIATKRFASRWALDRACPFATPAWSVDEAAFELAKRSLPAEGGTIHFPRGHYVATARGWRIDRDHVRLTGEGAGQTVLSTGPRVLDGLTLSGYRHIGWARGAAFGATDGAPDTDTVTLQEADRIALFAPGQLVFIRNGANRFDQDFGEFNEVAGITTDGRVTFRHPFARDYRLAAINWAGRLAADFVIPPKNGAAAALLATDADCFVPGVGEIVSIGENVFRVERVDLPGRVVLRNPGRANASAGTRIGAGTFVAKERTIVRLTASTRDFQCERLTVRGRRKALNLSNSYDSRFEDCVFERVPGAAKVSGGLTIDGDGGRFAQFVRCTVRAQPAIGMQFARSFGGVSFDDCVFVDTNVAFTEFNFDCAVTRSRFDVTGTAALQNVVIVGKSCDDLRVTENRIHARGVAAVFDARTDIQSFKRAGALALVIRDNTVETSGVERVFALAPGRPAQVDRNAIIRAAAGWPAGQATALVGDAEIRSGNP